MLFILSYLVIAWLIAHNNISKNITYELQQH
jgi:hypothetical protein